MRRSAFLPFSLLFVLFLLGLSAVGWTEEKAGYAGKETCRGCHENYYASYATSVHGKKSLSAGPANREACETCHGPGEGHIRKGGGRGVDIFVFSRKTDALSVDARCLTCHEEGRTLTTWNIDQHRRSDVSCTDCHKIHTDVTKSIKADESELCLVCHKIVRNEFTKQSRHPVREGLMKCSDCHEHHGTFGKMMLKGDEVNELCYKCHAEKRGPFVVEHSPVQENCLNCHEAHGSNHARLLVRKPPMLCQSCHNDAGLDHVRLPYTAQSSFKGANPSNKFFARACLNCHTNVHGSSGANDRFLR